MLFIIIHSNLDKRVVDTFINHQGKLLELLEKAQYIDLEKTKNKYQYFKADQIEVGRYLSFCYLS
ncbi:hypothetical protein BOQ60_25200 [Chryseobacterium sp. CH1]|nr:hypothetical protein BOQ60_25200 [Chryseobacterium sp. CH1]